MKMRTVGQTRIARPSVDGAGVHLRRVFWRKNTFDMDPFLLLDLFDSTNPDDYTAGFPLHPHRGIETFTYLIEGEVLHKDSMGNKGRIGPLEYQWMSAGSGILHEEMPQPSPRMLGFQLWINLPQRDKRSEPSYLHMTGESLPVVQEDGYYVRVLSGRYRNAEQGEEPKHIPVNIYDIDIQPGRTALLPVETGENAFLAVLQGSAQVGDTPLEDKAAATLVDGDTVEIKAGPDGARIAFFAGVPLEEPIAWGGSIVMNTEEELNTAYRDLENGTFIKHSIQIED